MLTYTELRERLGVSKPRLDRWLREGLPFTLEKRQKKFDPQQVIPWLRANGKTAKPSARAAAVQIATTRAEAARILEVSTRTFAEWLKIDGFPGRAGAPGRQDGEFPIAEIRAWRQAHFGGDSRSNSDDDKLRDAKFRKLQIQTDREQVEFEMELGYILDAQEIADFLTRLAATVKTMLEQVADRVESRLPEAMKADTKARIRSTINESIESTLKNIAELADKDAHRADDRL